MKKALALILTAAMLLSTLAIAASAERVWTKEEIVKSSDYVYDADGAFSGIEDVTNGSKAYVSAYFKVMTVPGSSELGENVAHINGTPIINMKTGKLGINGLGEIDYTFAADTWYEIEFYTGENNTFIYVNGDEVGKISGTIASIDAKHSLYASWYRLRFSEVTYKVGDDVVETVTYDPDEDFFFGSADAVTEIRDSEIVITNENVASSVDYVYDADGAFSGIENVTNGSKAYVSATFKVMTVPGSSELGENVAHINGTPIINMKTGKLGINGLGTVDYTFAADTWYEIEFYTGENNTFIYVNGDEVGKISGTIAGLDNVNHSLYASWYRLRFTEVTYKVNDEVVKHVTYAPDEDFFFGDAGSVSEIREVTSKTDLGLYYLDATAAETYTHLKDNSGERVSFDFMLASADAYISTFANGITLTVNNAGASGATVDFAAPLKVGTWYNIEYVCDGSSTAIYLDGALVGTVAKTIGSNGISGFISWMAIDNFRVDGRFDDFEDQSALEGFSKDGGPSAIGVYEFLEEEPVDPYTLLDCGTPEGEAVLIDADREAGYSYFFNETYPNVQRGRTVYAFNLALVANDCNGLDDGGKTWFGFWRDTGSKRFKIGFESANEQLTGFAGEGDSVVGFDWGAMDLTNFHDVIVVFNGAWATIYIDNVLLYTGEAGAPGFYGNGATGFEVVNGSAVVDNFKVYNTMASVDEAEIIADGFGQLKDNGNFDGTRDYEIGADCDTNGCIYGSTKRTTEPTCHSVGEDTFYCAVCGEAFDTEEIGMIGHSYGKYNLKNVQDGCFYASCNGGCGEKRFAVIPEEGSYTGTMHAFFDMSDDLFAKLRDGSEGEPYYGDTFEYVDGVARATAKTYPGNYQMLHIGDILEATVDGVDHSYTFDLTYNGTWDTDDNINSNYPHMLRYAILGKCNAWVIFDFDANTITLTGNQWNGVSLLEEVYEMEFVEGETYNVQFTYKQYEAIIEGSEYVDDNGELVYETEMACDFYVLINGEVVIAYDYYNYADLNYGIAYDTNASTKIGNVYMNNFGVAYDLDNFVIGTSDFAWEGRTYVGDVDGNNYLEQNDALCMRKFLAKVIDDSALATTRMDMNGDGAINAKDQLAIRKALIAA